MTKQTQPVVGIKRAKKSKLINCTMEITCYLENCNTRIQFFIYRYLYIYTHIYLKIKIWLDSAESAKEDSFI